MMPTPPLTRTSSSSFDFLKQENLQTEDEERARLQKQQVLSLIELPQTLKSTEELEKKSLPSLTRSISLSISRTATRIVQRFSSLRNKRTTAKRQKQNHLTPTSRPDRPAPCGPRSQPEAWSGRGPILYARPVRQPSRALPSGIGVSLPFKSTLRRKSIRLFGGLRPSMNSFKNTTRAPASRANVVDAIRELLIYAEGLDKSDVANIEKIQSKLKRLIDSQEQSGYRTETRNTNMGYIIPGELLDESSISCTPTKWNAVEQQKVRDLNDMLTPLKNGNSSNLEANSFFTQVAETLMKMVDEENATPLANKETANSQPLDKKLITVTEPTCATFSDNAVAKKEDMSLISSSECDYEDDIKVASINKETVNQDVEKADINTENVAKVDLNVEDFEIKKVSEKEDGNILESTETTKAFQQLEAMASQAIKIDSTDTITPSDDLDEDEERNMEAILAREEEADNLIIAMELDKTCNALSNEQHVGVGAEDKGAKVRAAVAAIEEICPPPVRKYRKPPPPIPRS